MSMSRNLREEILTEQQRQAGFDIEDDEDFVYLYDGKGEQRAVFSAFGATAESLRVEADSFMKEPGRNCLNGR